MEMMARMMNHENRENNAPRKEDSLHGLVKKQAASLHKPINMVGKFFRGSLILNFVVHIPTADLIFILVIANYDKNTVKGNQTCKNLGRFRVNK